MNINHNFRNFPEKFKCKFMRNEFSRTCNDGVIYRYVLKHITLTKLHCRRVFVNPFSLSDLLKNISHSFLKKGRLKY